MHLAYLDPGTGSMIVTFFVGGLATIGVLFKTMGRKITAPFRRKTKASESQPNDPSTLDVRVPEETHLHVPTDGQ